MMVYVGISPVESDQKAIRSNICRTFLIFICNNSDFERSSGYFVPDNRALFTYLNDRIPERISRN